MKPHIIERSSFAQNTPPSYLAHKTAAPRGTWHLFEKIIGVVEKE